MISPRLKSFSAKCCKDVVGKMYCGTPQKYTTLQDLSLQRQ